jgi:uncharacterized protein YndB with AHSA1/START domain
MATLKVEIPENSQNILGTITINAPLEKVFEAHVNKELFEKWFSGGFKMKIHSFEAKSGGNWHITNIDNNGTEYEFVASFHEIAKNERVIWTFEFLGMPERGHVALEKMTFRKVDEKTTEIHTVSTYQSVEERNTMVESGMEDGWRMAIETLEKVAQ